VSDVYDIAVSWHPFLLRPNMPAEGVAKPPVQPGQSRVPGRLGAAGSAVGIEFTGKCDRYPNSVSAHAALEYAGEQGQAQQNNLQEAIFKAYFTDGVYPDVENLVTLAGGVSGLDVDGVRMAVTNQERLNQVKQKAKQNSDKGVTGVPCFFMNGQRTFSGAQDPAAIISMFHTVNEKFPLQSNHSTDSLL